MKHILTLLAGLTLTLLAGAQNGTLDITLREAANGKAIYGANIKMNLNGDTTAVRLVSDISGKALASLKPGTYSVSANLSPEFYGNTRKSVVIKSGETLPLTIWLTRRAEVSVMTDSTRVVNFTSTREAEYSKADVAYDIVEEAPEPVGDKTIYRTGEGKGAGAAPGASGGTDGLFSGTPGLVVTTTSGATTTSGSSSYSWTPASGESKKTEVHRSTAYKVTTMDASPAYDAKATKARYKEKSFADEVRIVGRKDGDEEAEKSPALAEAAAPTPTVSAGILTAGEINDFGKWKLWKDITADQLKSYTRIWGITPQSRYTVQVTSQDAKPIVDATVEMRTKGKTIWTARTDNTGKAELWAGMYGDSTISKEKFEARITYKGQTQTIDNLKKFHDGINTLQMRVNCDQPEVADIVFMVDATSSMSDEITYLQAELNDVIEKEKKKHKDIKFNLGSVFYRDLTDEYVTKKSDLSPDISKTIKFIGEQKAGGGGDFPEAADSAFVECINNLKWSENARTRILFMVLDAPPHANPDNLKRMQDMSQKAAKLGIRIVPVAASGIDKSTEYLMRTLALATNGTYVFLTDHSGVGNHHIEPTTDKYEVEKLNDVLLRVIDTYSNVPKCDEPIATRQPGKDTLIVVRPDTVHKVNPQVTRIDTSNIDTNNTKLTMVDTAQHTPDVVTFRCYPNPTNGPLTIELEEGMKEIYLADISGKLLRRYEINGERKLEIDIGEYSTGIYYVQCPWRNDKWLTGKIVLVHETR